MGPSCTPAKHGRFCKDQEAGQQISASSEQHHGGWALLPKGFPWEQRKELSLPALFSLTPKGDMALSYSPQRKRSPLIYSPFFGIPLQVECRVKGGQVMF